MKEVSPDSIPALPEQAILNGECVALGIPNDGSGILIHYLTRDKAVLIEWGDIVTLGLTGTVPVPTENKPQVRVIAGPTK